MAGEGVAQMAISEFDDEEHDADCLQCCVRSCSIALQIIHILYSIYIDCSSTQHAKSYYYINMVLSEHALLYLIIN